MADQARLGTPTLIRAYGYPKSAQLESPLEMEQVTLASEPRTLRRLADFLNHAADVMEQHGDQFGHEHYSDFIGARASELVDVVVTRVKLDER